MHNPADICTLIVSACMYKNNTHLDNFDFRSALIVSNANGPDGGGVERKGGGIRSDGRNHQCHGRLHVERCIGEDTVRNDVFLHHCWQVTLKSQRQ